MMMARRAWTENVIMQWQGVESTPSRAMPFHRPLGLPDAVYLGSMEDAKVGWYDLYQIPPRPVADVETFLAVYDDKPPYFIHSASAPEHPAILRAKEMSKSRPNKPFYKPPVPDAEFIGVFVADKGTDEETPYDLFTDGSEVFAVYGEDDLDYLDGANCPGHPAIVEARRLANPG